MGVEDNTIPSTTSQRRLSAGFLSTVLAFACVLLARFLYLRIFLRQLDGMTAPEVTERLNDTPVIVVGGGLAGLSAVFEAIKAGSKVVLIEKNIVSGNSAKATSGINAVLSKYQSAAIDKGLIQDSVDNFFNDTMKAGHMKNDPKLVKTLTARSGEALDTLTQEFGLSLTDIQQLGGHTSKRTHRFPPKDGRVQPVGWTVVSTLKKRAQEEAEKGNVIIMEHTAVTDIVFNSISGPDSIEYPYVTAVDVMNKEDNSTKRLTGFKSVVLTAGGYAADSTADSVLAKYRSDLVGFPTTNDAFASGDMIKMALKHGLRTSDLDAVQLHPTGFVDPKDAEAPKKFLCPEVMRGVGSIMVKVPGVRFVDELLPRDKVAESIRANGGTAAEWGLVKEDKEPRQKIAMMIMTEEIADKFGIEAFKFYVMKGFIQKVESEESLKQVASGVDYKKLVEAAEAYDQAADGTLPDECSKVTFPSKMNGLKFPFYIGFITPSLHFTMGGIHIDSLARALRTDGVPTLNLFVAGETAGGIHGKNRLGGNGCLESIVFGQIAGRSASKLPADIAAEDAIRVVDVGKDFKHRIVEVSDNFAVELDELTDSVKDPKAMVDSTLEILDRHGKSKGTITVKTAEQTELGTLRFSGGDLQIYPGDFVVRK